MKPTTQRHKIACGPSGVVYTVDALYTYALPSGAYEEKRVINVVEIPLPLASVIAHIQRRTAAPAVHPPEKQSAVAAAAAGTAPSRASQIELSTAIGGMDAASASLLQMSLRGLSSRRETSTASSAAVMTGAARPTTTDAATGGTVSLTFGAPPNTSEPTAGDTTAGGSRSDGYGVEAAAAEPQSPLPPPPVSPLPPLVSPLPPLVPPLPAYRGEEGRSALDPPVSVEETQPAAPLAAEAAAASALLAAEAAAAKAPLRQEKRASRSAPSTMSAESASSSRRARPAMFSGSRRATAATELEEQRYGEICKQYGGYMGRYSEEGARRLLEAGLSTSTCLSSFRGPTLIRMARLLRVFTVGDMKITTIEKIEAFLAAHRRSLACRTAAAIAAAPAGDLSSLRRTTTQATSQPHSKHVSQLPLAVYDTSSPSAHSSPGELGASQPLSVRPRIAAAVAAVAAAAAAATSTTSAHVTPTEALVTVAAAARRASSPLHSSCHAAVKASRLPPANTGAEDKDRRDNCKPT